MQILLFLSLLIPFSSFAFECKPDTSPNWKVIAPGVSYSEYSVSFTPFERESQIWGKSLTRKIVVRGIKVDLAHNALKFWSAPHRLRCNNKTDEYIHLLSEDSKEEVLASINSNFFHMLTGSIEGVAVDSSTIWSNNIASQKISSSTVLGIGKTFDLEKKEDLVKFYGNKLPKSFMEKYEVLVQGYPELLKENRITVSSQVMNSRRPRTAIAKDKYSSQILLITIDAQGEDDNTGMTLYEFGHLLASPNCGATSQSALNLDGGGSSAIYVPSEKVSMQASRCRPLGNVLNVVPRE